LAQIIGLKIALSSYITMEMDMDNTKLLTAIKEMMETQIGSVAANMKPMQEQMKANQAKRDARKDRG
jgi:hypothetical protein